MSERITIILEKNDDRTINIMRVIAIVEDALQEHLRADVKVVDWEGGPKQ